MLGSYINNDYKVQIYEDGTKIRMNDKDSFNPIFPESMDIKITDYCECNCPYCHENSSINGKHGDIMNVAFIDSLHSYTELAIGGGNPLAHPDLCRFLNKCKEKHLIPSMTVNQKHFISNYGTIKDLCDDKMIYGLGVSLANINNEFIDKVSTIPNAVIHIINGVVDLKELERLYDKNLKILILGYKMFRRGKAFYNESVEQRKQEFYNKLSEVMRHFKVVSFDNLAIKQLQPQRTVSSKRWDKIYMGNDGKFTMYVDMVNKEFAMSSTSTKRYPMMDNIKDMFNIVRSESNE